jgi:hypothetical protein
LLDEPDRANHLSRDHGYLSFAGLLLPRSAAVSCLWERVFTTGDPDAHRELLGLLDAAGQGPDGETPYVHALEAELRRRADDSLLGRRRALARFVRHLRDTADARPHFRALLTSANARVRALARELVLPDAADAIASAGTTAGEVRAWLDRLCPFEDVWGKIHLCQRLARQTGAELPVQECLRQLETERPVACPDCGAAVPQNQLESHLRREHRVHQFRGVRRSLPDTFGVLFACVCGGSADPEAWAALEALAPEEYGAHGTAFLAARLAQELTLLGRHRWDEIGGPLADVISASSQAEEMVHRLAGSGELAGREFALLILGRMQGPFSNALVQAVSPLLIRKRARTETQLLATVTLLQAIGSRDDQASAIIDSLVARCRKSRALQRMWRVREQLGACPALAERIGATEARVRMRCPRCGVQCRRPEMTRHLWDEHGLVLDGQRVRGPWQVIEEWLRAYRRSGDPDLLLRCRRFGLQLDPSGGLRRVHRLSLACGVDDLEARHVLSAEASVHHASLCPRCFALVPLPPLVLARPLNVSRGRLSLQGYLVEVSETGLVPRLVLETPRTALYRGYEPGRWLTRRGATLLLVGVPVAAALCVAALRSLAGVPAQVPVAMLVGLAVLGALAVRARWRTRTEPMIRAIAFAWGRLVPYLHADRFSVDDADFLAGLCLTSLGRGLADARAEALVQLVQITEEAAARGAVPLACYALLERLRLADAAALGEDPVSATAQQVARCFEGSMPLGFAQELLAAWEAPWWTAGELARLRALLCDRAFEAGLEVEDLLRAGELAPALGEVLHTSDAESLCRLRLLWSLRPRMPWARWSDAWTAFELAAAGEDGKKLFTAYPDLLLVDRREPRIVVTGQGVLFRELLLAGRVRIEARVRRDFDQDVHELLVGEQRFQFPDDAAGLAARLESWLHFHFGEFRAQLPAVRTWRAPGGERRWNTLVPIPCPECGLKVEPRAGDVGVRAEGPGPLPPSRVDSG